MIIKNTLKALLLSALMVCPLFGQVTTGFHRVDKAVTRGSGATLVVQPNAKIYVTSTATGGSATIYSDPLLSIIITGGTVTADANGNYGYYIPLNYCVNERVTSPGAGDFVTANICSLGVSGSTMTGQVSGFAVEASSPTTATGPFPMDDSVTTPNTITAHKAFGVNDGSGLGGGVDGVEGSDASPVAGHDKIFASASSHCYKYSPNGASAACLASGAGTSGQLAYYAGTGSVLHGLTLGTNLSITGSTLNATGGGGGSGPIDVVANIAAFRTYTGSDSQVNVVGYYSPTTTSPPDGGGGIFVDIGAGTSIDDDGGVTIYNTVTGHDWKRMVNNADTYDAWFGVRRDDAGGPYDNYAALRNVLNYVCFNVDGAYGSPPYGSDPRPFENRGTLHFQSGLIQFSQTLHFNCVVGWTGAGTQVSYRNGTELQYTGSSTPAVSLNMCGFSSIKWGLRNIGFSTNLAHPTTLTDLIEVEPCTANDAGGSFQLQQGIIDNVRFENVTGAGIYFKHAAPLTQPYSGTGYISDGTGAAPGNILCLTSGTLVSWVSGSGIPDQTYITALLDSSSIYPVTCTGPGGGTPYLITGPAPISLNISSEAMTSGYAVSPYAQEDMWTNIQTSQVGSFFRSDYSPNGQQNNVLKILNFSGENGQIVTAGLAKYFADFQNFAQLRVENFVDEGGGASSPYVFSATGGIFQGLYFEIGSMGAPMHSIFDIPEGTAGGIQISDSYLGGAVSLDQGYVTFEPYVAFSGLAATNAALPSQAGPLFANIGNAKSNGVSVSGGWFPAFLTGSMVGGGQAGGQRCAFTANGQGCGNSISPGFSFIDKHGDWLDGLSSGLVSLSLTNIDNEGIKTDSNEGRVFEMVGQGSGQPDLSIAINNIPPDLRGNQFVASERWKFHSTQSGYAMCPLGQSGQMLRQTGTGGVYNQCTVALYVPDTWYTTYFVGILPDSGPATVATTAAIGGPASSSRVTFDVSSLYIGVGTQLPVTMVGGNPAETKTWACTAAPTYGDYIVGDTCINSAPSSGNPTAWVNTVAGSPGTWKPYADLP